MDVHDPTDWLLLSVLVGAAVYTAFALVYRQFHVDRMRLMALGAVAVPSGVDLIVCAFRPSHLVHLIGPGGGPTSGPVTPVIGEMHRIDLVGGGAVLVAIGLSELVIEVRRLIAASAAHRAATPARPGADADPPR